MFVHETLRVVCRNRVVVDTVCGVSGGTGCCLGVLGCRPIRHHRSGRVCGMVASTGAAGTSAFPPPCHVVCWASPDDTCPRRMPPCPSS